MTETLSHVRADLKPRILYIRDAAGRWVYYGECNSVADAHAEAARKSAAGCAVRICDQYHGPEIVR